MKWFTAKAKADSPGSAHIVIDGEIGQSWWSDDGIASRDFMNSVKGLGELSEIVIDLNSPGGSVSDGVTIANYLKQHQAKVTINILGQASSIASVIAAAGDEVNMGLGSWGLLHDPWTVVVGNADQLRAMADDLDTLQKGIMDHYIARCGTDKTEQLNQLIKGESGDGTLLSAQEWVDLGLADSVMAEVKAAASMTGLTDALAHAKQQAEQRIQNRKPPEAPAPEPEPKNTVQTLTLAQLKEQRPDLIKQVEASAGKAAQASERERVTAILKACDSTGQMNLAENLIEKDFDKEQAQSYILDIASASSSRTSIFNSHSQSAKTPSATIDSNEIYSRYNRKPQQ